jgi:hypothetical protein
MVMLLLGARVQDAVQPWQAALALELHRRDVHAQLDRAIVFLAPALDAGDGLAQHPFADIVDQAGFLGQRNEAGRADRAQFGMVPAQQRFGLAQASRGRLDDGLVEHLQLALRERRAQVVGQPELVGSLLLQGLP